MKNILLVDDESIDLQWMEKLIVNNLNFVKVIQTAHSGPEGLRVLETEKVDIILSDIRMPIMSGTDFAYQAKQINPSIKIIFISGHEEFEYAKEAIKLSASGYLLKPVDDAELLELITKVCEEIEASEQERNKLTEILNEANQELLLRWLEGGSISNGVDQFKSYLSAYAHARTMVGIIEADEINGNNVSIKEESSGCMGTIQSAIQSYLQDKQLGLSIPMNSSRVVLITELDEARASSELEDLIKGLNRKFAVSVTIGMSTYGWGIDSLGTAFRQAKSALSAKWFLGKTD